MSTPKIWNLVKFAGFDGRRSSRKAGVEECQQNVLLLEKGAGNNDGRSRKEKPANGGLPPKGYVAMYVGKKAEGTMRFMVPAKYLSMPAFQPVMEMVREEFGFEQSGGLCVPCDVEDFMDIVRAMEMDYGGKKKVMESEKKLRGNSRRII